MFGNTNTPASLVTTGANEVPRVSLLSTTVAPGMTPPCESLTVPLMLPVVICALAGAAAARIATIARASIPLFLNCMLPPPVTSTCSESEKNDRPGAAFRCPAAVSRNGAGRPLHNGLPVACAQPSSRGGTASRRALRAQPPGSFVNACVRGRSRSAKPSATCMQSLASKRFHNAIQTLLHRFRYAMLRSACPALGVPRFDWQHAVSDRNTPRRASGWQIAFIRRNSQGILETGADMSIRISRHGRRPQASKTLKRRLNSSSGWSSGSGGTSAGSRASAQCGGRMTRDVLSALLVAGGAPPPPARVGPTPREDRPPAGCC